MDPSSETKFEPLRIALLTISDTRDLDSDKSGGYLQQAVQDSGHTLVDRMIVRDDVYQMRAAFSRWIADAEVDVIISTGGTGIASRDSTPEAVTPLFDKSIDGFGELFRYFSLDDVGPSTIQSRALAGLANRTLLFCLPGSTGACRTAWDKILLSQLDIRTRPCNFALIFRN